MYSETTASQHIEEMDALCTFMLREAGVAHKIDIKGRATGVLDYEVDLHHGDFTYTFDSYEKAQQRAKELHPNADWETTGW